MNSTYFHYFEADWVQKKLFAAEKTPVPHPAIAKKILGAKSLAGLAAPPEFEPYAVAIENTLKPIKIASNACGMFVFFLSVIAKFINTRSAVPVNWSRNALEEETFGFGKVVQIPAVPFGPKICLLPPSNAFNALL